MDLDEEEVLVGVLAAVWALAFAAARRPGLMSDGVEEGNPGAGITSMLQLRRDLISRNHFIRTRHPLPGLHLIHPG